MKNKVGFGLTALYIPYVLTVLFLGGIVLASIYTRASPGFFARDPLATLGGHPLMGIQSYLGILVWVASASICFFCCAFLNSSQGNARKYQTYSLFFLWSGVITLWLALDDLFLIHEYLPRLLPGLTQPIIYFVYGIAIVAYTVTFRKIILRSDKLKLFLTAVFFLGLSVFIDIVQDLWDSRWRIFFEDGFKLLGIVSWSSYFIESCFQRLKIFQCRVLYKSKDP